MTTGPTATNPVAKQIEGLREKLLDLSTRNRLLNFTHREPSRQHIRIVDELPDLVFTSLVDEKQLTFRAVPDPEDEFPDEQTPRFKTALRKAKLQDPLYLKAVEDLGADPSARAMRKLEVELRNRIREQLGYFPRPSAADRTAADVAQSQGIDPSPDLPSPPPTAPPHTRHTDPFVQTAHFQERMDAVLSGINQEAKKALEEAGVNMLFAAFGFLEWYDSDASEKKLHAPLLLIPLQMERKRDGDQYRTRIKALDEQAAINTTLLAKLKEFNVALPGLRENEKPETYFARVTDAIKTKPDWRVKRWITVGLFNFTKIVMYEDLDPHHRVGAHPLPDNPKVKRVLTGFGRQVGAGSYADDRDVDKPPADGAAPHLIDVADASQLSAIQDVIDGKDLVIEGPPGTGKSQTITNIIGDALARGKTVLFVAEKLAALNVVKSRLDKAGVGTFCLELHSTKVDKKQVAGALKARLQCTRPRATGELSRAVHELKQRRDKLAKVALTLNKQCERTDLTPYQAIWRADAVGASHPKMVQAIDRLVVPGAMDQPPMVIQSAKAILARFRTARLAALSRFTPLESNPWWGVEAGLLSTITAPELCQRTGDLAASARRLIKQLSDADERIGVPLGTTLSDVIAGQKAMAQLVATPVPGDFLDLGTALLANPSRQALTDLCTQCETYRQSQSVLQASMTSGASAGRDTAAVLRDIAARAARLGVSDGTLENLDTRREEVTSWLRSAHRASPVLQKIAKWFGASEVPERDLLVMWCSFAELVASTPQSVLHSRQPGLLEHGASDAVRRARQDRSALDSQRHRLASLVDVETPDTPDALDHAATQLERPGLLALLSSSRRAASRLWTRLNRANRRLGRDERVKVLRELAQFKRDRLRYEQDPELARRFGPLFRGLNTDVALAEAIAAFGERLQAITSDLADEVIAARRAIGCATDDAIDVLFLVASSPSFADAAQIGRSLPEGQRLPDVLHHRQGLSTELEALATDMRALNLTATLRCRDCEDLATAVERAATTLEAIHASAAKSLLRDHFKGAETDTAAIRSTVRFVDHLLSLRADHRLTGWLIEREPLVRQNTLRSICEQLNVGISGLQAAWEEVSTLTTINCDAWLGVRRLEEAPLATLAEKASTASNALQALHDLRDLEQATMEVRNARLEQLTKTFVEHDLCLDHLEQGLEYLLCKSVMARSLDGAPELKHFAGSHHESIRHEFKQLDDQCLQLTRRDVVSKLLDRDVPKGKTGPLKSEWTGQHLVENEANKDGRHIPIRQLLERAGDAVQQLMPCFLMSPLSVAQFLPQGLTFDLVVMDEASQLRPEDAIGAIARGGQLVVVGDPKQLPPTSFFQTDQQVLDDDEADDGAPVEQSVLELAMTVISPARRLKFHYRSQHESLISYSRHEFYDGDLVVFPTPAPSHDGYGVCLKVVEGLYRNGQNPTEAKAVCAAAVDIIRRFPDRSLGIVAMNRKQTDLINDEMDRLFALHPDLDKYRVEQEGKLEPFFVKNLENVQGDERDTIIISTVYGKDEAGAFKQNFGPVNNKEAGHRRLNVLFTRAKCHLVVCSSINPDDIRIDQTSARGTRVLKEFLKYARDGQIGTASATGRAPDSDFEVAVAKVLGEAGFEVDPQVGTAGYRVDIGVRHPKHPGRYVLGIECDGATYHSARSVRDRDRLRQEVLELRGWKIHRIWSLDWFKDRKRETQRLLDAVAKAIGNTD